jgi:protein gp37
LAKQFNTLKAMSKSSIEWTQATWNPSTGCNKVSAGCKFCYAERMTDRLVAMGVPKYDAGFQFRIHPEVLDYPKKIKKPTIIFVNSMSDLFHEQMPLDYLQAVFQVMAECPQHTFQVLTKRAERLLALSPLLEWPPNVWMGVSVENQAMTNRIPPLVQSGAQVKFLSIEPFIGPIADLDLHGMDWVIVGGESGPGARPMESEWVMAIRDQCLAQRVPFFFKQWGGTNKNKTGRLLDGRTWDEMPKI